MNALILAAAFGILILILQDGRFEFLLSYTSQGGLDLTISLVLAAFVFAVSAALSLLGPQAWWMPASLGRLRRRITHDEELPPEIFAEAIADHR
jgi:hypothetical protein